MQYSLAALLAVAGTALAQVDGFDPIFAPSEAEELQAGETFTIEWDPSPATFEDETVDILLLAGADPGSLDFDDTPIAEGIDNSAGAFEWEIPATLGQKETYGIQIQLSSDASVFQRSFPFKISPSEDGEDNDETPIGNSTVTTGRPTKTATDEETEETEESDYSTTTKPKTTTTLTSIDNSEATETSTTESPAGGVQATAGAFAVLGGLAIAAMAL